jgi:hypothetical protein
MARGRKPRVRVSEAQIDKARKKIKSTPKRGRWPKYDEIHKCDLEDYIECFKTPSKSFLHPTYKNACFRKKGQRGEGSIDPNFHVELPSEYDIIGTIRFYCESYDPHGGSPLIDTVCMLRCERISCPYYKKGFVTETLKNKTFESDVTGELNKRHNIKQEIA